MNDRTAADKRGADWIAPDCHGQNFYRLDPAFRSILRHYMAPDLHAHVEPQLDRLGGIAGGRLDTLSQLADRHPPVLHARDRFGRDRDWIEYHPAYREMESIAFEDFGLHAMSHRGGVLGWPEPFGPLAKYAFQYLFVQGEFGLMCPISLCDTSIHMVTRYADPDTKARYLPRMTALSRAALWTGTQFMTEQAGGSDVANLEVEARFDGDWRIYGDKWFCSHTDADLILTLARTEGRAAGSRGTISGNPSAPGVGVKGLGSSRRLILVEKCQQPNVDLTPKVITLTFETMLVLMTTFIPRSVEDAFCSLSAVDTSDLERAFKRSL